MKVSGGQWPDKRQWTQSGRQEVPSDHQKVLLCIAGAGVLAQVAQRGCGLSSLEVSRSHLDMVTNTLLWVSLLEQRLDQMDTEVPSNLNHPLILLITSGLRE